MALFGGVSTLLGQIVPSSRAFSMVRYVRTLKTEELPKGKAWQVIASCRGKFLGILLTATQYPHRIDVQTSQPQRSTESTKYEETKRQQDSSLTRLNRLTVGQAVAPVDERESSARMTSLMGASSDALICLRCGLAFHKSVGLYIGRRGKSQSEIRSPTSSERVYRL